MKQTLKILLDLTELDLSIQFLQTELSDIPQKILDLKNKIQLCQTQKQQAETEVEQLKIQIKTNTEILADKNNFAKDRESRLPKLATQKEYQAVMKEIAVVKKEIHDLETQIKTLEDLSLKHEVALVDLTAETDTQLTSTQKQLVQFELDLATHQTHLHEQTQRHINLLALLTEPKLKTLYTTVVQKAIPALSCADDGDCLECGAKVLPQVFNKLKAKDFPQNCNRCKRILYLNEFLA